ncbi:MAG: DUF222 domain-containing protein [Microbacteriaceae bacterium]
MAVSSVVVPDAAALAALPVGRLLALQSDLGAARRRLDADMARVAGEIARRSERSAGQAGLAQRTGARTPHRLVQQLTGVTAAEARNLVSAGRMLADAAPWLAPVTAAVDAGRLSPAQAAAIRAGLGAPDEDVAADDLQDAAVRLTRTATTSAAAPGLAGILATAMTPAAPAGPAPGTSMPPEDLQAAARAERDALDEAGIVEREERMRSARSLSFFPQPDGMTRVTGLLDPESAAIIRRALDAKLAPRRGGPRFLDPEQRAAGQALVDDPRTNRQLTLDALVETIDYAMSVDHDTVFGTRRPAVTLHVQQADLERGTGRAWIEGTTTVASVRTAERFACAGIVPIAHDPAGHPLDLGRETRTFTSAQRRALAARDGGCMIPGYSAAAWECEAHHCAEWQHGGRTDIADGILLCRFHHMWLHHNRYRIERRDDRYLLIPPPDAGASAEGTELRSKNPIRAG